MARSIEPVPAAVRPRREPVVVQPEILRPLPTTFAQPRQAASFSHGVVVDASILARLLGIRLLRLRAHIDVMPFDAYPVAGTVERYSIVPMNELSALPAAPGASAAGTLAHAAELLQHASRTLGEVRRERVAGRR